MLLSVSAPKGGEFQKKLLYGGLDHGERLLLSALFAIAQVTMVCQFIQALTLVAGAVSSGAIISKKALLLASMVGCTP